MILPIVLYGQPVLRQRGRDLAPQEAGVQELIDQMFDTMYNAHGVGLAAPQVGHSLRLFVIDGQGMQEMAATPEEAEFLKTYQRVIINPVLVAESGPKWGFEEGCLSIPGIRETVQRHPQIQVRYLNRQFEPVEETLSGIAARIFQHEYDHIEGVLFTDHLSPLKKQILRAKLTRMAKRGADADYPIVSNIR
ncbi:MAG: peptide deformylase [Bacteroidetes bacterium]|nr:peptide deformylase [Bacteroidota bacterium]